MARGKLALVLPHLGDFGFAKTERMAEGVVMERTYVLSSPKMAERRAFQEMAAGDAAWLAEMCRVAAQ